MTDTDCIPLDDVEFANNFGPYVSKCVARMSRRPENFADILQSIWLRLLEGKIVEKFWLRFESARLHTMTTEELCGQLGIPLEHWLELQGLHLMGRSGMEWLPAPVRGEATSLDALWSTLDVERCEEMGFLIELRILPINNILARPTPSEFRTYVQRAIGNAFANWVRTHSRRNKDHVFGDFRTVSLQAHYESFEDFLAHTQMSEDSTGLFAVQLDLKARLGKIWKDPKVPKKDELFSLLERGHTVKEALRVLHYSPGVVRRIRAVLTY